MLTLSKPLSDDENRILLQRVDALLPEVANLLSHQNLSATIELCVHTLVPALRLLRLLVIERVNTEVHSSQHEGGYHSENSQNSSTSKPRSKTRKSSLATVRSYVDDHREPPSLTAKKDAFPPEIQQEITESSQIMPWGLKEGVASVTITRNDTMSSMKNNHQDMDDCMYSSCFACNSMNPLFLGDGPSAPTRTNLNITGLAVSRAMPDVGSRRGFDSWHKRNSQSEEFGLQQPNRCYINPEGRLRVIWDLCSMGLILILMLVTPFELCFLWDQEESLIIEVINWGTDIFFFVDIVLNCFTAFHKGKGSSSRLVTRPRVIMKNYASHLLWVDLVATFPFSRIAKASGTHNNSNGTEAMGMLRALRIAKVARMLKVLRVLKLGGLMQLVEEQLVALQSMTVAFQLMKLTVIMLLISHCTACMWFAVGYFGRYRFEMTWLYKEGLMDKPAFEQYVASFYFAITTGTTVGYGDIYATNTLEQIVGSLLLVAAVAYIGHFLARVGQVVSSLKQSEAEMVKAKRDAMLFMRKRNVAKDLYRKVLRYIEHIYETESITSLDSRVLDKLSESLQMQLALAVTGNILKRFPLFSDADDAFVTAICRVCHTRRACVGDILVQEEQTADEMYLIVRGEVLVLQENSQVGVLSDEDWFGERSLFLPGLVHNVTIRCETDSEFLVLYRTDFKKQLTQFPRVRREYDKIVSALEAGSECVEAYRSETCEKPKDTNSSSIAQAFRFRS